MTNMRVALNAARSHRVIELRSPPETGEAAINAMRGRDALYELHNCIELQKSLSAPLVFAHSATTCLRNGDMDEFHVIKSGSK